MTKIALLTDPVNTARKIAQALLDAGLEGRTVHVVEDLEGLPEPDRVFIGGGGGDLQSILRKVVRCLKGRGSVVATAITLESLMLLSDKLALDGFRIEVSQVQDSRLRPLGQGRILSAHNPVFVIKACR